MILTIETSSPVTSVALGTPAGDTIAPLFSNDARGHVEFLMPAIVSLLDDEGVGLDALTGIGVGLGPGLFTSMRAGIATAKTLAITLGVPLVGVCSLDIIGHSPGGPNVCAAMDARRGEVFYARYESGTRVEGPSASDPAALAGRLPAGTVIAGNAQVAYPGVFDRFATTTADPTAVGLLPLTAARLRDGAGDDPIALEPMYVRRSDAEIKWERHGVVIERPMRVKTRGS